MKFAGLLLILFSLIPALRAAEDASLRFEGVIGEVCSKRNWPLGDLSGNAEKDGIQMNVKMPGPFSHRKLVVA